MDSRNTSDNISGLGVLDFIGFNIISATPERVHGKFVVSKDSCQPFGVLHGGVSAFIAESVASMGAQIASNFQRVAGIELNINHLQPVPLGHEVEVEAVPLRVGRRIQVWDVKLSGLGEASSTSGTTSGSTEPPPEVSLVAVSRVTLVVGLPNPSKGAHFKEIVAARSTKSKQSKL